MMKEEQPWFLDVGAEHNLILQEMKKLRHFWKRIVLILKLDFF